MAKVEMQLEIEELPDSLYKFELKARSSNGTHVTVSTVGNGSIKREEIIETINAWVFNYVEKTYPPRIGCTHQAPEVWTYGHRRK